MNPSSDYVAFDVSADRQVYALAYKHMIRTYSYQSSIPRGRLAEAVLPASWMVITDIRFSTVEDDGSIYATVQHSDALFRCDARCPYADFRQNDDYEVVCSSPFEQGSWSSEKLAVQCTEWSALHYLGSTSDDYFSKEPLPGYFFQGGCHIVQASFNAMLCASGTYRANEDEEAARIWLTNTGKYGGSRSLAQVWTASEFGQLLAPPAYNRVTGFMFLFAYGGNNSASGNAFSVFQVRFNNFGSRIEMGKLVYSHVDAVRNLPARIIGCSIRMDWNKMIAVDESVRNILVFQLPSEYDLNAFRLLSSGSYGASVYKDVEFVHDVKQQPQWWDLDAQRQKMPAKLFLTSIEAAAAAANARAELYVQCAPCKDGGVTDASKQALSQADCLACKPGFHKLSNNSGCMACEPCKQGEYLTGTQCSTGTDVYNVACKTCRRECPAGSFVNGTCTGNSYIDQTSCPECGTVESNQCPVSLLPQSSIKQDEVCVQVSHFFIKRKKS